MDNIFVKLKAKEIHGQLGKDRKMLNPSGLGLAALSEVVRYEKCSTSHSGEVGYAGKNNW